MRPALFPLILALLLAPVALCAETLSPPAPLPPLPDFDDVVAEHRAISESIRSGRITYVEKASPGATDVEAHKAYYKSRFEKYVEQLKTVGADESSIDYWTRELSRLDESARRNMVSSTQEHRVYSVFDLDQNAAKSDSEDLRDVASLLSRYGVSGDPVTYTHSYSTLNTPGIHTYLDTDSPHAYISPFESKEIHVQPLGWSGLLRSVPKAASDGGDESVLSVDVRRDPANPSHIIIETLYAPQETTTIGFVKNGQSSRAEVPLDEPVRKRFVTVIDESQDFRRLSRHVYENDALRYEYLYSYSDDLPFGLAKTMTINVHLPDGSLERTNSYTIESADLNVAVASWELELIIPPGTWVYDRTSSPAHSYRIPSAEDLLDAAVDLPELNLDPEPLARIPAEVYPPGRAETGSILLGTETSSPSSPSAPPVPAEAAPDDTPASPALTPTLLLPLALLAAALVLALAALRLLKRRRKHA